LSESRKWAVYCIANLQFKTYFKLKTITLCKNLIKSIEAQADMPPWNLYPKAHRVTYMYYCGVIAFLQEDYNKVCYICSCTFQTLTYPRLKLLWLTLGHIATREAPRTENSF
jgi:hypothetical protein